ncbi:MAG: endonuclease VIII Nei2 [Herpetosiphon sp.]
MAEGHAVVRWARALQVLIGEPITAVKLPKRWSERTPALIGQSVIAVRSHGKHLLLDLSGGETLHTHAMQYGSWQVGDLEMQARKLEKYIRLRLVTSRHEAVFYHGPVIELLTPEELRHHTVLTSLGPDVMAPDFDRGEAFRRIVSAVNRPIGDVILDQNAVAGLGNIYKSEGLFLAHIDPRRAASALSRPEIDSLFDHVIPLMEQGTQRYGKTVTTSPEMVANGHLHWVYRRRGHPCFRCGMPIEMLRQGELERSTYFCPHCQQ